MHVSYDSNGYGIVALVKQLLQVHAVANKRSFSLPWSGHFFGSRYHFNLLTCLQVLLCLASVVSAYLDAADADGQLNHRLLFLPNPRDSEKEKV